MIFSNTNRGGVLLQGSSIIGGVSKKAKKSRQSCPSIETHCPVPNHHPKKQ